jgi:SSS family solute:Na+ symporter
MSTLSGLDWAIIGIYFAALFGLAWWVILQNRDTADDYFLAGRNLSWWIIGGSIFASNIGSEHLVGLAGSGATDGVAMAHYELHAWCLLGRLCRHENRGGHLRRGSRVQGPAARIAHREPG